MYDFKSPLFTCINYHLLIRVFKIRSKVWIIRTVVKKLHVSSNSSSGDFNWLAKNKTKKLLLSQSLISISLIFIWCILKIFKLLIKIQYFSLVLRLGNIESNTYLPWCNKKLKIKIMPKQSYPLHDYKHYTKET